MLSTSLRRRSAARRCSSTRVARGPPASLSAAAEDDDDARSSSSSSVQVTPEAEATWTSLIAVDVTGATYARQCAYLRGLKPTSQLPPAEFDDGDDSAVQFFCVVRGRPPSSRRSSAAGADYGFAAAAPAVVRRVPSTRRSAESVETTNRRRATSETREYRPRRPEMTSSGSTTAAAAVQPGRGRTTVRQLKRRSNRSTAPVAGEDSGLCSWRHSLCAGFKSSKCGREDAWAESRPAAVIPAGPPPSTSSTVMVTVVPTTPRTAAPPSRSQSLPRSFRSSLMAPLRRLLSSRSLSSTSDVDAGVTVERPSSSRRLVRTASDCGGSRVSGRSAPTDAARPTPKEKPVARSQSLERGPSRRTEHQRSFSRTASMSSRSATLDGRRNASMSSSSGADEVYAEIQDQPRTRPFATVQLRTRGPRHDGDVDGYQSSGTLPLLCLSSSLCLSSVSHCYLWPNSKSESPST